MNGYQFTSKQDAMGRAQRRHVCLDCSFFQSRTFKNCPECGSTNRQYFMSKAEHRRGMLLLTLQRAGTISRLRFQPRYELRVVPEGNAGAQPIKIGVYTADVEFYEGEKLVIEDTKPADFIDAFALHKIKHFEAQYGITVRIPQRKSGNRSKKPRGKTLV